MKVKTGAILAGSLAFAAAAIGFGKPYVDAELANDKQAMAEQVSQSIQTGLGSLLQVVVDKDTCDSDNTDVAGKNVEYQGHGNIGLFGRYLNSAHGSIQTLNLFPVYVGDHDAVLGLGAKNLATGQTGFVVAVPSAACRQALLAKKNAPVVPAQ